MVISSRSGCMAVDGTLSGAGGEGVVVGSEIEFWVLFLRKEGYSTDTEDRCGAGSGGNG